MNEVEKMYENAGIKKVRQTNIAGGDYPIAVGFEDYPPFTAEKQIELIKWLARFNLRIEYTEYENAKYFMESHYHGYSVYLTHFEESLASLINSLWQDLTEIERNEIRNILRG